MVSMRRKSGGMFRAGNRVSVTSANTWDRPGGGLAYPAFKGIVKESGSIESWDIVDVENERTGKVQPVYSFSIKVLGPRKVKGNPVRKAARSILNLHSSVVYHVKYHTKAGGECDCFVEAGNEKTMKKKVECLFDDQVVVVDSYVARVLWR